MFNLIGMRQRPLQRPRRAGSSNAVNQLWTPLREPGLSGRSVYVMLLALLVASLAGCATPSPPDQQPRNPAPPRLSEPLPQSDYSSKVENFLRSLRERLTPTPAM